MRLGSGGRELHSVYHLLLKSIIKEIVCICRMVQARGAHACLQNLVSIRALLPRLFIPKSHINTSQFESWIMHLSASETVADIVGSSSSPSLGIAYMVPTSKAWRKKSSRKIVRPTIWSHQQSCGRYSRPQGHITPQIPRTGFARRP